MNQLWAPWRMEFIESKKESGCVFCRVQREASDRENLVLKKSQLAFVILNKYPYNNGHLMIVPNAHTADYAALPLDVLNSMHVLSQQVITILTRVMGTSAFNCGMNLGIAAGAGIADHLHLHVVPRWVGDTNFMPVVSEVKSMPQHLLATYDTLFEHFRRLS